MPKKSKPAEAEEFTANAADTRVEITRLSARGYTQLRHILVQLPDTEPTRVSSVGTMVHTRKHRALLLYILLLTAWPWLHDRREPLEASVWIRALDGSAVPDSPKANTWSASTLSRAWADLKGMNLITTERKGRLLRVTPRREDGGDDYEFPGGRKDRWNAYFSLPDAFWLDGWFAKLSLPALAMLLLIAKETNITNEVWLTYDNCEEWYGIRPKSAQNGITELIDAGLLHRRREKVKASLSPTGYTTRSWYSLTGEFGHTARAAKQKLAAKERRKRLAKKGPTITAPSPEEDASV
jgi:hypothetical protein